MTELRPVVWPRDPKARRVVVRLADDAAQLVDLDAGLALTGPVRFDDALAIARKIVAGKEAGGDRVQMGLAVALVAAMAPVLETPVAYVTVPERRP